MRNNYYCVLVSYGGSIQYKSFTNKRKARSYCYHWINDKKYIVRCKTGQRDYAELKARITDDYNNSIAYYN